MCNPSEITMRKILNVEFIYDLVSNVDYYKKNKINFFYINDYLIVCQYLIRLSTNYFHILPVISINNIKQKQLIGYELTEKHNSFYQRLYRQRCHLLVLILNHITCTNCSFIYQLVMNLLFSPETFLL